MKNWVRKCPKCLEFKTLDQKPNPMKIIAYKYPFHTIGIDFVGELPCSPSGNRWILTIVYPFSNYLKAVPVKDKKAATAAKVLFEQVFLQFGFPSVLSSDRGGEWLNAVFQQLLKLLSIYHICTTSYRPRLNESTERTHRWSNTSLGIFCEKYQESWEHYLQAAAYVYSVTPIAGTDRIDPFLLVFGRRAPSPKVLSFELPSEEISHSKYAAQLITKMH